jgi:ATP-dependent DNA ligase
MNGNNWTARYPRIVEEAARIKGSAILDAGANTAMQASPFITRPS